MKEVVSGFEGWQNKISNKKIWGPIFTPPPIFKWIDGSVVAWSILKSGIVW